MRVGCVGVLVDGPYASRCIDPQWLVDSQADDVGDRVASALSPSTTFTDTSFVFRIVVVTAGSFLALTHVLISFDR
jgi:hypothetical protein